MTLKLSPRTWFALAALGPAIYVAIQALPLLRSLFLLLLVTVLLALLIYPLADTMERRGVSRGLTTGAVLFGALAILVGLLLLLLPILFESLARLGGSVEGLATRLAAQMEGATGLPELGAVWRDLLVQANNAIRWAAGQFGGVLAQVGAIGFGAFVSFAVIFALVADKRTAPGLMRVLLPERYHARAASLTRAVSVGLSRWFVAQLAICAYYAVAYSLIGLLAGIPFAIQIGVISGLLEFIPYLGGLVGMGLSLLSAATVGPTAVLIVLGLEAVAGAVAVYVVVPYAFARAIDVPPALILLGLFVGGLLGGFFAALLTVPMLAVGLVVLRELRPDLRPAPAEKAAPRRAGAPGR